MIDREKKIGKHTLDISNRAIIDVILMNLNY